MAETTDDEQSPLTILLWSLFLGMSWTWCIGMFLPVILVREFGLAGWIVFAVPNVLGAAAMGWVLRTRESSVRITENHADACAAFSWVTIAFHLFFVSWFVAGRLFPEWGGFLFLACFMFFVRVGQKRAWNDLFAAAMTFLLSVILIAVAIAYANHVDVPRTELPAPQWSDAALLATVCVFGFALCPYLDPTFHRARQNTSNRGARRIFGLGFCLFFLLMIAFTAWYAPFLATAIGARKSLPAGFAFVLASHLLVQSALTVALHSRHIRLPHQGPLPRVDVAGILLVLGSLLISALARKPRHILSLDAGELIYRCFMGFYALVFPAYVWLCILPDRGASPPTKRHLLVFAASVLIALPMFWVGFIHQKLIWLLPGLLVVLLSRLALPRRGRSSY